MGAASAAACATPPRRHPVHSSSETVMLERRGVASPRGVQGSRLSARQTQRPGAARRPVTVRSTAVGAAEGLKTRPWTGSERELKAVAAVEARMAGYPYGTPSTETIQWFLRDRQFDVEEAVEKLQKMLRWRSEFRVDEITDAMIAAEAATGKAVLCEHCDVNGQPVILVRVDRHVTGSVPLEDSERLCVSILEKAESIAVESGVETMLGIFDLKRFSGQNADFGFAAFLVSAFFTYYPKRLSRVLFVDAPWVFQPAWAVVRPWLGKYAALVEFVRAEDVREKYFAPNTCPSDFLR